MANYYCEYCGANATSVSHLTSGLCMRHPIGANKGKHSLYQGSEKSQYTCRYCGTIATNISHLTNGLCRRHPDGSMKGHHLPAL
jgi:hypothetical protein